MSLPRPTRPLGTKRPEITPTPTRDQKGLRPSDLFRFEPQPDITLLELAELLATFLEVEVHFTRFQQFPENLQRHFRHKKI